MILKNTFWLILLCCFCQCISAQIDDFQYKKSLQTPSETWHSILLPNDILATSAPTMNGMRIFGFTATDTLEAPYILNQLSEDIKTKKVNFKILNQSKNSSGHFITFKVSKKVPINQILVNFKNKNFDWKVKLEGSQNQRNWFTLLEDYRILSIINNQTNYQFTELNFSNAQYHYYRLWIDSKDIPKFQKAYVNQLEKIEGQYINHPISKQDITVNKEKKETIINLDFGAIVPVNYLNIDVNDKIDFYRKINIQYLIDSAETSKGLRYVYRTQRISTLNSIDKTPFKFSTVFTRKLKISIKNYDNQALDIGAIEVKGFAYELIARLLQEADYFLYYGNKDAKSPQYDITHFKDKIPSKLKPLELGETTELKPTKSDEINPLFKNKIWLWVIMGLIILLLGWFSLKMMKEA